LQHPTQTSKSALDENKILRGEKNLYFKRCSRVFASSLFHRISDLSSVITQLAMGSRVNHSLYKT